MINGLIIYIYTTFLLVWIVYMYLLTVQMENYNIDTIKIVAVE